MPDSFPGDFLLGLPRASFRAIPNRRDHPDIVRSPFDWFVVYLRVFVSLGNEDQSEQPAMAQEGVFDQNVFNDHGSA